MSCLTLFRPIMHCKIMLPLIIIVVIGVQIYLTQHASLHISFNKDIRFTRHYYKSNDIINETDVENTIKKINENMILAARHITISSRYAKTYENEKDLWTITKSLSRLLPVQDSVGFHSITKSRGDDLSTLANVVHKVTIILNAVNEVHIPNLNNLQNAVTLNKGLEFLVGFNSHSNIHTSDRKRIESKNKNIRFVEFPVQVTLLQDIWHALVKHVETEFLIFSRKSMLTSSHNKIFKSVEQLVGPLIANESDVTGATPRGKKEFDPGCYQAKALWYQYRIERGYDIIDKDGYAYCDYVSGPFAMKTNDLVMFLEERSSNPDIRPDQDHLYVHLLRYLTFTNQKTLKMSFQPIDLFLHTATRLEDYTRKEWITFLTKYGFSKIILPGGKTFEYACDEIKSGCAAFWDVGSKTGKFLHKCCIFELENLLLNVSTIFDHHNFDYELDSGTLLGSAKLMMTLPWERDHDLVFRSNQFTSLLNITSLFQKYGYSLNPKLNSACLNSTDPVDCGYVGVNANRWRMELWGKNIFPGDYIRKMNSKKLPSVSRFKLNRTLSLIGNRWMPTTTNPGRHSRKRFGLDVLKHARHWYDTESGGEGFNPYVTSSIHWEKCSEPGHHACSDNYLADGNRQYRDVWV